MMPVLRTMGLAAATAVWLAPGLANAQTQKPGTPQPTEARELSRAKADTLWLIADAHDETAVTVAKDIATVFAAKGDLRVLPVLGDGATQSIADILFLKGIDVGIVQEDTLLRIKTEKLIPEIADRIRIIAKLYTEELHLIAGADIARIEDLAGKTVNFGPAGAGSALTAKTVFAALGIDVKAVAYPRDLAISKVQSGEIAATVTMTGAAAPGLTHLSRAVGLKLLAVPYAPALQKMYLPALLTAEDYPGLVERGEPVETVAVSTVMAVFNWQKATSRYRRVGRFIDGLFSNLDDLRAPSRHRKWHEVNLAAPVSGWTRFAPAEAWLKSNKGRSAGALEREFKNFLANRTQGKAKSRLSPGAQEELFREFVRWRGSPAELAPRVQ